MQQISAPVTAFSLALLRRLGADRKNILLSPLSILGALAMTANGADGETLHQIEQTLGLPLDLINRACRLPPDDSARLHTANAIWIKQNGPAVRAEFLAAAAEYFSAEVRTAPMNSRTCQSINRWIEEKTDGMICRMLDRLDPCCVMCLISALAFRADWQTPYLPEQVRPGRFTDAEGTTADADFLFGTESTLLSSPAARGFLKPYRGRYAFAALLPHAGQTLTDLLGAPVACIQPAAIAQLQAVTVRTAMPKFSSACAEELRDVLQQLGMSDAFSAAHADFTRMADCSRGNLFIGSVRHSTRIDVTEQGTRAGAATVVQMLMRCARPAESHTVTLDRPFLYQIIDRESGFPIFIGTLCRL